MEIFDFLSKRQRRLRGEFPDVYTYDDLPNALRVQVVHIIRDALGVDYYGSEHASKTYEFINRGLTVSRLVFCPPAFLEAKGKTPTIPH